MRNVVHIIALDEDKTFVKRTKTQKFTLKHNGDRVPTSSNGALSWKQADTFGNSEWECVIPMQAKLLHLFLEERKQHIEAVLLYTSEPHWAHL